MRLAGRDLLLHRVAVARRAALQDVGDEDVGALQPDAAEQLVEQLSRLADEGDPLLVLVEAGRLADEHQLGVRVSGAEDDLRASGRKRTTRACCGLVCVGPECGDTVDDVAHGESV